MLLDPFRLAGAVLAAAAHFADAVIADEPTPSTANPPQPSDVHIHLHHHLELTDPRIVRALADLLLLLEKEPTAVVTLADIQSAETAETDAIHECCDNLSQLRAELVAAQANQADPATLQAIFDQMHANLAALTTAMPPPSSSPVPAGSTGAAPGTSTVTGGASGAPTGADTVAASTGTDSVAGDAATVSGGADTTSGAIAPSPGPTS